VTSAHGRRQMPNSPAGRSGWLERVVNGARFGDGVDHDKRFRMASRLRQHGDLAAILHHLAAADEGAEPLPAPVGADAGPHSDAFGVGVEARFEQRCVIAAIGQPAAPFPDDRWIVGVVDRDFRALTGAARRAGDRCPEAMCRAPWAGLLGRGQRSGEEAVDGLGGGGAADPSVELVEIGVPADAGASVVGHVHTAGGEDNEHGLGFAFGPCRGEVAAGVFRREPVPVLISASSTILTSREV
jgi:hypothetical protein